MGDCSVTTRLRQNSIKLNRVDLKPVILIQAGNSHRINNAGKSRPCTQNPPFRQAPPPYGENSELFVGQYPPIRRISI